MRHTLNPTQKYDLVEALAGANGLLHDLPDIRRKHKIEKDYLELLKHAEPPLKKKAQKIILCI